MTLINAIIQGIIQGLSEFLPISSSGHLSLFQYFTGVGGEEGAFFTIILHLGTLFAVFIAFRKIIWGMIKEFFLMIKDIFTGNFSTKDMPPERRMIFLLIVSLLPMILTVFLKDWFESFSTDNSIVVEGIFFLVTSILLFLGVKYGTGNKDASTMRYRDALLVGGIQAVAPIPGLSRSGSTISVGLLCGLSREYAVAFSFIMGIPPIIGANLLEIPAVVREGINIPASSIFVGLIASFIFGLLAIKLVNLLVTSDKFKWFAWYTLILGLLVTGLGIYEDIAGHPIQRAITSWLAR